MQVIINGESHVLNDGIILSALLAELEIVGKRIAVEINESIVPKSQHASTVIQQGDKIEIIHAIGGG
jgi:sulfur carrier protein